MVYNRKQESSGAEQSRSLPRALAINRCGAHRVDRYGDESSSHNSRDASGSGWRVFLGFDRRLMRRPVRFRGFAFNGDEFPGENQRARHLPQLFVEPIIARTLGEEKSLKTSGYPGGNCDLKRNRCRCSSLIPRPSNLALRR